VVSMPKRKRRGVSVVDGSPLESTIVHRCRVALARMPGVTVWRNNVGEWKDPKGFTIVYGLCVGSADLVGLVEARVYSDIGGELSAVRIGRFFALEVKRPGKVPTDEQEVWMAQVRKLGGFAAVVTSEQEALEAVMAARRV
jgi:hypothetical protein